MVEISNNIYIILLIQNKPVPNYLKFGKSFAFDIFGNTQKGAAVASSTISSRKSDKTHHTIVVG
jgi:hypothetical protein